MKLAPSAVLGFKAGRNLSLGGRTYAKGDRVPNSAVRAVRNLSPLLNRRWLIPARDPWQRKLRETTPTPTDLSPKEILALPPDPH